MNHLQNIARIKSVANALAHLNEKVVFVGGATISLYAVKPALDVRPTDDIDVIVEILNYSERIALEEKLRAYGFANDIESGVICRYKVAGIIVDIMPTNDPSIGFSNRWYPHGFTTAISHRIDERTEINILTPPHFIATKLEAYKGRGEKNGITSHDFEDIVFLLEHRDTIWEEMSHADDQLKKYLLDEFRQLLDNPYLFDWIDAHVERNSPPATYSIMDEIKKFIAGNR